MIRFVIGLLIVFGVAGGLDAASDTDLLYMIPITIAGLLLMLAGANAVEEKK